MYLKLNSICSLFFVLGTGKTLTGVALIKLFCNINEEYLKLNSCNKHFVLYCGPSNKSVDLVTGTTHYIFKEMFYSFKEVF